MAVPAIAIAVAIKIGCVFILILLRSIGHIVIEMDWRLSVHRVVPGKVAAAVSH
jgi:hypothetical protein